MVDRRKVRAFTQRVAAVYGMREADVPAMFTGARATSARVNRLHRAADAEAVRAALAGALGALTPVPWADDCYYCAGDRGCADAVPMADRGEVYLQNASSLIPAVALDPQPGETVLDMAAAPGGKAFHLAARTRNDADLWLNDGVAPRAGKMASLAELYDVRVARLTVLPAQYLDKELPPASFDRILLDVQCSGEGRVDLRRSDALRHWSEERIDRYRFLQTKMLDAAYRLLRPGGTVVYSTCTVSPEENEFPVSQVLRRHDDLDVVPLGFGEPNFRPGLTSWRDLRFDQRVRDAVRVLPTDVFEGFFAAKLRKEAA